MPAHTIRYTVKPERVVENDALVDALFADLAEVRPAGMRLTVLKLDDGVTYLHLIDRDHDAESLPGKDLHAFRGFHHGIRERCEQEPVRTGVTVLGEFGAT